MEQKGARWSLRTEEKSLYSNCGSPRHTLNYLWARTGICLIFTMETNATVQCMHSHTRTQTHAHTHTGRNCHGIQRRGDRKLSATRPIYSAAAANWTPSHPPVSHSLISYSLSLSLFPSTMHFFLAMLLQNNYLSCLFRLRTRSSQFPEEWLSQSSGVRRRRRAAGVPRDAQGCGWATGTAGTHPPLPPPVRAAAADRKGRGRYGKKKKKKSREKVGRGGGGGVALSAAGTLHHRLPLWKGGRGEEWTEEGRCSL